MSRKDEESCAAQAANQANVYNFVGAQQNYYRLEALRIAHAYGDEPSAVVARAEAYLAFLNG